MNTPVSAHCTSARPEMARCAPSVTEGTCRPSASKDNSDIDFSRIDSVQKALAVPALNPATFLLQLKAIASAEQAHQAVASDLTMHVGLSTSGEFHYTMNDPDTQSLEGKGTLGGQNFEDAWWYNDDEGGWSIAGQVGSSPENLLLTQSANGSLFLRGDIGEVHVHEVLKPLADHSGLEVHGKIGHQTLQETVRLGQGSQGSDSVHVEGQLGGQAILFDAGLSSKSASSEVFQGQGNLAGLAVSLGDTITLGTP